MGLIMPFKIKISSFFQSSHVYSSMNQKLCLLKLKFHHEIQTKNSFLGLKKISKKIFLIN
jgi:hypothetical protein